MERLGDAPGVAVPCYSQYQRLANKAHKRIFDQNTAFSRRDFQHTAYNDLFYNLYLASTHDTQIKHSTSFWILITLTAIASRCDYFSHALTKCRIKHLDFKNVLEEGVQDIACIYTASLASLWLCHV